MSHSVQRACLLLTHLDDRIVPSTVAVTTTARPFDFTGIGTLVTDDHLGGTTPLHDTSTSTVNVNGMIDYTDNTSGQSGTVTISGTGTGTRVPEGTTDTAEIGPNSYAQTVVGNFSFEDADGQVSTVDPLTATETWFAPGGANGIDLVGPVSAAGTFDISDFKLAADWNSPSGSDSFSGNLTVTLVNKTNAATDLSFGSTVANRNSDGNLDLDFRVDVTGKLPFAASHASDIARVTAAWEGKGKSQAAEIDLPVLWNTGTITVEAHDLVQPDWAETLTVRLDADGKLTEGDETNNSWTITLADLAVPVEQPPVVPPPVQSPPVIVSPPPPLPVAVSPPAPPAAPTAEPVGFSLTADPSPLIEWRDAAGQVIGMVQAIDDFTGRVEIAAGDVNGDGVVDAAVAAGEGGGPRVRVFDGKTGSLVSDFFAYDSSFRGGVHIAMADLNGDGHSDIIAGAGSGGGPHVRVFDGQSGQLIGEFFAYNPDFRGGVRVAAGDLDGDGVAEVITGTGAGGGPVLAVFDGLTGTERFRVMVGSEGDRGGLDVKAAPDPSNSVVIVTADTDGDGPARRFRSQLKPTDPLLVQLIDPIIPPPPVFEG